MDLKVILEKLMEIASLEGNEWAEQAAAILSEKTPPPEPEETEVEETEVEETEDWEGKYKKLHSMYVERFLGTGEEEESEESEEEESEEEEDKTKKSLDELLGEEEE